MNRRLLTLGFILVLLTACTDTDPNLMVGQLETERVQVSGPITELIVAMPVAEGQHVAEGDVLFQLDPAVTKAARARAVAVLAVSEAQLAETRRGPRSEIIAAAAARQDQASEDLTLRIAALKRVQDLQRQNLASDDDYDQALAAEKMAQARLKESEATLAELQNGSTTEELAQAAAAVEQAQAELAMLDLDLERLTVRAPVAGRVEQVLIEQGERPRAGDPVLTLLRLDDTFARIYVPAQLRAQARVGQPVELQIQGQDALLGGRLRWVSADAAFTPYFALTRHDRDRLTYPAEVALQGSVSELPAGMPLEARFVDP
ncbi:MAG: HlyD family efflux transporter periplasmic adaptor subunit [Pseudomonadota bacterium]